MTCDDSFVEGASCLLGRKRPRLTLIMMTIDEGVVMTVLPFVTSMLSNQLVRVTRLFLPDASRVINRR